MAGTYLQQDVYGEIQVPNVTPLFKADSMSDHQLISLLHSLPAVKTARKQCEWIVATSLYQPKTATLQPPRTNNSECWLAFVDREEHAAAGWTKIAVTLFSSYERNENFFKVALPAVLQKPLVYLNHALPQARCLSLAHFIRGKESNYGAPETPHLLASKIPGWSGRAVLSGQLEMTWGYLLRRNATTDIADLAQLEARMAHAGFNSSQRLPVTDTLWMIWPVHDAAAVEIAASVSRLWLHEVARYSSYEKTSYPWIVSQVPKFRPRLTDAIYIYSPEQRCGDPGGGGGNSSKKKRRTRSKRGRSRRLLVEVERERGRG